MDEIRYVVVIWLLTLTTSFRCNSDSQARPWGTRGSITRVSKYKETHMRGDAFLPNDRNTQVTSFLLFPTMQLNQIKKKNWAHRFHLFHPPALMGRVQRSVVQGWVYLLPPQILYRFLNSLCNITGAFLKSALSNKGAVSQNLSKFSQWELPSNCEKPKK